MARLTLEVSLSGCGSCGGSVVGGSVGSVAVSLVASGSSPLLPDNVAAAAGGPSSLSLLASGSGKE